MQLIDYDRFPDGDAITGILPPRAARVDGLYERGEGAQYRSSTELLQDAVRIDDGVLLLACEYSIEAALEYGQVVRDSDWIHIQCRMSGGGTETVSDTDTIATPESSCIISRYPENATIRRQVPRTEHFKAVCLLMKSSALPATLDTDLSRLPLAAQRLVSTEDFGVASAVPLRPAMLMAANDILGCEFRGALRLGYMRAKALELLTLTLHALEDIPAGPEQMSAIKLSARDLDNLSLARTVMMQNLENTLTLAELARKVGLNRTKLALGFKKTYGISVQAHWRDLRLARARELLAKGSDSVTDVALSLGYSELSSFTQAFTRKFGVLPRDCRSTR